MTTSSRLLVSDFTFPVFRPCMRRSGEIGRRTGLKIPRAERPVPVRLRPPAPVLTKDSMSSAIDGDVRRIPAGRSATSSGTATCSSGALTHKSFANEHREPRSSQQRAAGVPGRRGARLRHRRADLSLLPEPAGGGALEDQGASGLGGDARRQGTGPRDRPVPADGSGGGAVGRRREAVASCRRFEAVVAAIYLDGGLPRRGSLPAAGLRARRRRASTSATSPSTTTRRALQETAQALGLPLPEYRIVDEYGPDHEKTFVIRALLGRRSLRLRARLFEARSAAQGRQGSVEEAGPAAG